MWMIPQEDNSYWKQWNNALAVIGQEGSEVSKLLLLLVYTLTRWEEPIGKHTTYLLVAEHKKKSILNSPGNFLLTAGWLS